MSPVETLRYSLGFLIGADNEKIAEHFRRIDFPLPLAIHPKTQIAVADNVADPLAILGEAVHPDLPHLDLQGIANHLGKVSEAQQEIDKLVGRFAVIQGGSGGDLMIQTDAIGLRSVYFSVSDWGVIAGSHARLVAEATPGGEKMNERPYRWGYPGLSTPYPSVCRLPPNCELSFGRGALQRFFPKAVIPETEIEESWDIAFNRASTTIRALAKRHKLLVSLSAGLDSRTTLAASRDSWPQLEFFTYNRGVPKDEVDAKVAAALAKTLGLRHVLVDYSQPMSNKQVSGIISNNTFTPHLPRVARAYHSRFGEHLYLHIRSNLLELGRSNLFNRFGKRPRFRKGPSTARLMGDFYTCMAKMNPSNSAHVLPAFEHYIAATDYESTLGKVSPWDMYFVEHRMGAWQSGVVLESDVSFDTVIAFNSREIVSHFMGVPQEVRCSSPHLRERLSMLLPEVMRIPVNPGRHMTSVVAERPIPMKQQKILPFYRNLCARIGIKSSVDANIEFSPETLVPHPLLRRTLQNDPAMSAILEGGGVHLALGSFEDAPFLFLEPGLVQLSSALIFDPAALAAAARWGLEAHHLHLSSKIGPRHLIGLARYGNVLIGNLEEPSRERLLAVIPSPIGAELLDANSLDRPSDDLLGWIAGLTDSARDPEHSHSCYAATELDYPIEHILVSGGDSRLRIDPRTGCNRYGVPPRPRPEAVHFSSSTASAITDYGFFICDLLRRDLLAAIGGGEVSEQDMKARLVNAIGEDILDLFGLDKGVSDVAIAPSGTDTELLAVLVAHSGAQGGPLVNVLVAPDESGSGVRLAASGCWFDDRAATGAQVAQGTAVWSDASVTVREIPIRDRHGHQLATREVNRNFLDTSRAALNDGNHLLVHVLLSSKTDLYAPEFDAVAELVADAPDRVDVVVDACQLRTDFEALGDMVKQGWMVQVSGSKFLTGPPFSGALIVPASLRPRAPAIVKGLQQSPGLGRAVDWLVDWESALPRSIGAASYGPLFRWLPALLEAKLFFHLPEAFRLEIMTRFREALLEHMSTSQYLRPLKIVEPAATERGKAITKHSILSFVVLGRRQDGELTSLSEAECKQLFELLNRDVASLLHPLAPREDALARQPVHIGQPVTLGSSDTGFTVLRLVLGARFFTIVGHVEPDSRAAALESEIADAKRAIAKVELLASCWWRLA